MCINNIIFIVIIKKKHNIYSFRCKRRRQRVQNKKKKTKQNKDLVDRLANPKRQRITIRRRNPHRTRRISSSSTGSRRRRGLLVAVAGFIVGQGFRLAPAILLGSRSKALSFKRNLHRNRRRKGRRRRSR